MNVTGVILAGGKSSRMGTDKSFVTFKGKQLVFYGIEKLQSICTEVLISANSDLYSKFNLPVVPDIYRNKGPLGGLHSVLSKAVNNTVLCLPCDTPLVKKETLQKLIDEIKDYDIALAVHKNGKEPLIAAFKKSIVSKIETAIQTDSLKLHDFIQSCNVNYIFINDSSQFKNVNAKNDLL